jgi:hypothetical protein
MEPSHFQDLPVAVARQLGPGYYARDRYKFVVPAEPALTELEATAAVFSAPVASLRHSVLGFAQALPPDPERVAPYAYLGAPVLVTEWKGELTLFRFGGTPRAESATTSPLPSTASVDWVRNEITKHVQDAQLSLSFDTGRELLAESAQNALSTRVQTLTSLISDNRGIGASEAFRLAMSVIRSICFGTDPSKSFDEPVRAYLAELASRFNISFANLPPESTAELYERFAVDDLQRKRGGVVYTPAWLARYVTSRLPRSAFISGSAVDPTCGSGTFLVCYLERLVEETTRDGGAIDIDRLRNAVAGYDIDPVAIEAARLSLDFFARALDLPPTDWNLRELDATIGPLPGQWAIGNLPFGYRTHDGRDDISAKILEHLLTSNASLRGLALILPDSFTYTASAATARRLLRQHFRVEDITRLPEGAFVQSHVQTLVLSATRAPVGADVVVRDVRPRELSTFRVGSFASRTFVATLPDDVSAAWRLSPFGQHLAKAEGAGDPLSARATVHVGLQVYGYEGAVCVGGPAGSRRPLLDDPKTFLQWHARFSLSGLPLLDPRADVRRRGPETLFERPKLIVRSTTSVDSAARLMAIADTKGLWFTDKFTGVWPTSKEVSLTALAAYLQSEFVRVWFTVNNPSRKLRVSTLRRLPVPRLPADWWERASEMATTDRVTRPESREDDLGLQSSRSEAAEWRWFNSAINTAFGIGPALGIQLSDWLRDQTRAPSPSEGALAKL